MNVQLTLVTREGEEQEQNVDTLSTDDVSMESLQSLTLPLTRNDISEIDFDGNQLTLSLEQGELIISDFIDEFGNIKEIYTVNGQLLFKDATDLFEQLAAPAAGNIAAEGSSSVFSFLDDVRPFLSSNAPGYRDLRNGLDNPLLVETDLNGDPDNPFVIPEPDIQPDFLSFDEGQFDEQQLPGGNVLNNDTDPEGDPLTVIAVNGQPLEGGSIVITLPSGAQVEVFENGDYQVLNPQVYDDLGLGGNDDLSETFNYTASDGDLSGTATVTITVNGENDIAIIDGDDAGEVTEDFEVQLIGDVEYLAETGQLTVSDPDNGESFFDPDGVQSEAGNLGLLTIDANGNWNYSVENQLEDIQSLPEGETLTDTFTVQSLDGTSQQIVITINGENDPAIVSGDDAGEVTEDFEVLFIGENEYLIDDGALIVSDPDDGQNSIDPDSVESDAGNLGDLLIDADGNWSYQVNNRLSEIQELPSGGSLVDTFTVKTFDGTPQQIVITIKGTNDSAIIDGDDEGEVTEDFEVQLIGDVEYLAETGQLTVSDPDNGESFFDPDSVISNAGNLGALTIDANGNWNYSIENQLPEVQNMLTGESFEETFTVSSLDGTSQEIVVTVKGFTDGTPSIDIVDSNGEASGDISVVENGSVAGSFVIEAEEGIATIKIGDTLINLSELEDIENGVIDSIGINGLNLGNMQVTGFISASGTLEYSYDPAGMSQDHSSGDVIESISLTLTDRAGQIAGDSLDINITDTAPEAVDDLDAISETNIGTIEGNVLSNDIESADQPLVFVGWDDDAVTAVNALGYVDQLIVNSDGSYSFSINNSHSIFDTLNTGDEITLTVDYQMADGDGVPGGQGASLIITIQGHTGGDPEIHIDDDNGIASGDISVVEDQVLTNEGFDISVSNGLQQVMIGATTISAADLLASATTNILIAGTLNGEMWVTGFDGTTISYSYDPTGTSQDHSSGEILETIAITVTDTANKSANDNLEILIDDTIPHASDDIADVTEGSGSISGNVLENDTQSADTPATAQWGGTDSQYGTLTANDDGSYNYELDSGNYDVLALADGDTLSETFTYMMVDSDGSISDAQLTITINGRSDDGSCPDISASNVYLFSGTGKFDPIDGGDGYDILVVNDTTLNFDDKPRQFDDFERLHLCGKNNNHQSQVVQQIFAEDVLDMTSDTGPLANILLITGDPIDPLKPNASPGDTVKLDISPTEWVQGGTQSYDGMEFNVFTNDGATLWIETELNVDDIS